MRLRLGDGSWWNVQISLRYRRWLVWYSPHIDYIQIHPTTLYSEKDGREFLISESVRGEGAILLNSKGERFVNELLPRDVVAGAIRAYCLLFSSARIWHLQLHPGEEAH